KTAEHGELTDWASLEAANDSVAERRMPAHFKRGLHVDPRLPIHLIKVLDWIVIATAAEIAARWGAGASLAQMHIGAALPILATALSRKLGLWLTDSYRATPATIRAESALGGLTLGAFIGLLCANGLAPNTRDAGALSAIVPAAAALLAGLHAALAVWIR